MAAATPIAGAPRMIMSRMAVATSSIVPAGHVLFVQRQAGLVDHDHAARGPFDCFYHVEAVLSDYTSTLKSSLKP